MPMFLATSYEKLYSQLSMWAPKTFASCSCLAWLASHALLLLIITSSCTCYLKYLKFRFSMLCRQKQLAQLTFETMRESYHGINLPTNIAKLLARPREYLLKYVRPETQHSLLSISRSGLHCAVCVTRYTSRTSKQWHSCHMYIQPVPKNLSCLCDFPA